MANTARDLIKCRISNTPGTSGNFTLSTAFTNSLLPASGDNGLQFKLNITENGVGTEIRRNCTYTHSTTTFSRGTMVRSTGAGDAALDFTAAAIVSVVPSAEDFLNAEQITAVATVVLESGTGLASQNIAAINAAIAANAYTRISGTAGTYYIDDPIFITGQRGLKIDPGITIKTSATYRHTMIRVGNAEFTGDVAHVVGVSIICATDGTTAGTGTLRRYTTPARLSWQAPGDTEGTLVDVSSLTLDTGRVSLASANGKYLHVAVSAAALAGPTSSAIKVVALTGAKTVTWSRTSNVTTITETAHGRKPGQYVVLCAGTAFVGQVKIETITSADAYTFADSRTNSSGSGEVYAVSGVGIDATGAWLDYNFLNESSRNVANAHAVVAVGVNEFSFVGGIREPWKYGVYLQGNTGASVDVDFYASAANSSTAAFQFDGATDYCTGTARGTSTDTLTAVACGDYASQCYLMSYDEGKTHNENWTIHDVHGVNCYFDLVRLAGAKDCWFRNGKIIRTSGSVIVGTDYLIGLLADASMLGSAAELNIDGLEIDGLAVAKTGATATVCVYISGAGANVNKGLVIRNINAQFSAEENGRGVVEWRAGNFDDITIDGVRHKEATWTGNVLAILGSGTATCNVLRVRNAHMNIDNSLKNTAWPSTLVNASSASTMVVNRLDIEESSITDVSSAGTLASPYRVNAGTIGHLNVRNLTLDGTLDIGYINTSTVAKITESNIQTINVSYGIRMDGPVGELHVGNILAATQMVDCVRIGYSSATMKVRSLGGMPATPSSGFHVNIADGSANSPDVNGADLVCDTTKLAAVTGNLVRSSATGKVAMYDGSAWTAIA